MRKDFDSPEEYMYSLQRMGVKLGLDKIRDFLANFDDPHKDFKSILVAGTNGKGSVCSIISNILKEAGYKTGLYISPHQTYFEERISVNGDNITRDELWELIDIVDPVVKKIEKDDVEKRPSFFEVLTTLAFLHFSKQDIDMAVLEVGMGGRLDATNVVDNCASVVTTIGMDHSKYLGDTKRKIAGEKAGVIKEGNHFVTEEKDESLREYFKDICREKGADYTYALEREYDLEWNPLRLVLPEYGEVPVPGLTVWQAENALTAITLVEGLRYKGFKISKDDIVEGIRRTTLPGRMDTVSERPWIIMDSAHNLLGMQALINGLKEIDYERLLLVIGVLEDKDYESMVDIIGPECDMAFVGEPDSKRRMDSSILSEEFSDHCTAKAFEKGIHALEAAFQEWKEGDLILVTGSIYLLGDVRKDGKGKLW
ncbi:MAG: folylpolyglutamate synthase/dihydrofolate synthase family protein [Candidatus Saliniplasma sp.]